MVFVLIDLLVLTLFTIIDGVGGRLVVVLTPNAEGPMSEIGVSLCMHDKLMMCFFVSLDVNSNVGSRKFQVNGMVVENKFYTCDSLARTIALGLLLGSKTVLQVIALAFSLSIRKVKLKGLNDAKFVAICIYITNFLLAVNLVAFFALKRYFNLFGFLFPFCVFCGTTAILALVFVPNVSTMWHSSMYFRVTSAHCLRNGSIYYSLFNYSTSCT